MRRSVPISMLIVVLATCASAHAQMFGPRQLGGFLSRQRPPGTMSNPAEGLITAGGALSGTERFLRSNRGVESFVGAATGPQRGFVGVTQAQQRVVPPAAASVRERRLPEVNREEPESNAPGAPYPPRLILSAELSGPTSTDVVSALETHLARAPIQWLSPLEVSMQGRTAILRGDVASAQQRALAEALVQFEPGVSDVQNDLRVVHSPTELPQPLPVPMPESPTLREY